MSPELVTLLDAARSNAAGARAVASEPGQEAVAASIVRLAEACEQIVAAMVRLHDEAKAAGGVL